MPSPRFVHVASIVSFASLVVLACGGTEESVFQEADGGASSSSSSGDPGPGFGDSGSRPEGCASNVLCGAAATCCKQGEECVEGACAAACASGVRCGAVCCPGGEVCLSATCRAPGKACQDSFDCEDAEFCEPTLGKCLPQPDGASLCQYKPPVLPLAPKVEWSWTTSAIKPGFDQVINTPIVIDLDGDKIPEVIVVTSKGGAGGDADFGETDPAFLRVLDGKTGLEKWAANVDAYKEGLNGDPDYRVNPRGTPAAGDLDGNGTIEIVVPRRAGGVLAFRANGSLLWESKRADGVTAYNGSFNSVTVALADLDNDGKAEVVLGGVVLDHTGKLVTDTSVGRERWGANDTTYGPVSIVADVDGDAGTTAQYVVTGNRAIRKDGTLLWDRSATLTDGYPAIADLDKDGTPELVVVANGKLRVQNAVTGALIEEITMPGAGRGGPPTIADFDNDKVNEIASANGTKYNVFEYAPLATPKLSVKWSADTQDGSSNVTGSSVFDFEGDGSAEVVYNDECYSRVYRGTDGTVLYSVPNSSATIHEMPVLVDVDGDNNTEYVVVANDRNHLHGGLACGYPANVTPRHGVFVYGDTNDKWVRTRKLWNQHAYHITNVASDGKIPAIEPRSWAPTENNDYRVSAQGKGVYNAPDLRVDLEVSTVACPTAVELRARVKNGGALGVAAGVKVRFYAGTDATGALLAEKSTTKALLPGESEVVVHAQPADALGAGSFFVTVDGASAAAGGVDECLEDNNSAGAGGIRCPSVK